MLPSHTTAAEARPAPAMASARAGGISLAAVLSAVPDAALALLFLYTWIRPDAIRADLGRDLMLVMLLEFIVVHSAGFMGSVMIGQAAQGQKAFLLLGLGGFYTLFVIGFALAFHTAWPLWSFWGLVINRMLSVLLKQPPEGEERQFVMRQWAIGGLFYLLGCFATVLLPLPRLGMNPEAVQALHLAGTSGLWISQPWRVMAFGFLYFGAVALSELNGHAWLPMRQSTAATLQHG